MNHPTVSKINWTSLVIAVVGLCVVFEVIPPAAEEYIVQITLILGPTVIAIFRTWFTGPTS